MANATTITITPTPKTKTSQIWHAASLKNSRKEGWFSVVLQPRPAVKSNSRNIFNYPSDFEKPTTKISSAGVPAATNTRRLRLFTSNFEKPTTTIAAARVAAA